MGEKVMKWILGGIVAWTGYVVAFIWWPHRNDKPEAKEPPVRPFTAAEAEDFRYAIDIANFNRRREGKPPVTAEEREKCRRALVDFYDKAPSR